MLGYAGGREHEIEPKGNESHECRQQEGKSLHDCIWAGSSGDWISIIVFLTDLQYPTPFSPSNTLQQWLRFDFGSLQSEQDQRACPAPFLTSTSLSALINGYCRR